MLPSFYQPIEELVGEDEPSNSTPSIDHNADELPFSALGGRRFEILGYLLEIDDAPEIETVTLVQSSADRADISKSSALDIGQMPFLGQVIDL